jgi:hypothetical protein
MLFSTSELQQRQKEILDYVDRGELVLLRRRGETYHLSKFHPATYNKRLPDDFMNRVMSPAEIEERVRIAREHQASIERCAKYTITHNADHTTTITQDDLPTPPSIVPPSSVMSDGVVSTPVVDESNRVELNEEELF